jgi:hypothetical protein
VRQPGVPFAIGTYVIPPHAPPAVAEAKTEFDAIATRWADMKGELQDAEEALQVAKAADLQAIVDMAKQGKSVKDAQARQRQAEALITDLRFRLKGLDVAVDQAGDRLAEAIAKHRGERLPLLNAAETDAAARFDEAMAAARAALDELRPARGAVDWLHWFDPGLARSGRNAQFAGGRLRVQNRGGVLKGEYDPAMLLDLAAKATTVELKPTATIHVPAHA